MNEVNAINPNVAIVENVAEMESVDVMAGADAATSGRPLIEVIDEGQVDLSSDGIESFFRTLLPLHYSPLSSPILPPTLLMLWMRATVAPGYVLSSFSLSLLLVKLNLAMRGVAFTLKPKVRMGLPLFVSSRFLNKPLVWQARFATSCCQ